MGSGDAGFPRFPRFPGQTKQIDKKIRHTPVLILGEASSLGIQLGVQNAMWQIPANNISQFSRKGHQAHWPCLGTTFVLDPTPMRIAGGSIRSVVWRIWHESALGTEYALPVLLVDTPRHTFLDWKRITLQMISKLKHQQFQFGEQWVKEALALFGGNTCFFSPQKYYWHMIVPRLNKFTQITWAITISTCKYYPLIEWMVPGKSKWFSKWLLHVRIYWTKKVSTYTTYFANGRMKSWFTYFFSTHHKHLTKIIEWLLYFANPRHYKTKKYCLRCYLNSSLVMNQHIQQFSRQNDVVRQTWTR